MIRLSARRQRAALLLLGAALLLSACEKADEEGHVAKDPVTIVKDPATGLGTLTLEPKAVERLGIQTVAIQEIEGRRVVDSSAVIFDAEGKRYLYVNPEPLVFTRVQVKVEFENDGRAWLAEGPLPGTPVVLFGAAELFGAETGIK